MVEFALIAPIFLAIFIAVFDVARLMAVYVSLQNAAAEGARTGAVANATNAQIISAAQALILPIASGVASTVPTICPSSVNGSASCPPLGTVTRSSGGALTVSLSYTFHFVPMPVLTVIWPNGIVLNTYAVAAIG